jgi:hypothetical protein
MKILTRVDGERTVYRLVDHSEASQRERTKRIRGKTLSESDKAVVKADLIVIGTRKHWESV